MSIDGYLDTATDERLVLSNDADLDRVDARARRQRSDPCGRRHRPQRQPAAGRARLYGRAQLLSALGLDRVTLLANNPDKAAQLERLGVTVVARMPTAVDINATNARYLATKARRGAHTLDLPRAERLDAEA
jgi:GTP cyclohydrolase II